MNNKKEKKITNTELLESINRSFSKVEEIIDKKIDTKVEELKNQIEGINKRIDNFAETKVSKIIFEDLAVRVEKLEKRK